jgi:hypothetical protein
MKRGQIWAGCRFLFVVVLLVVAPAAASADDDVPRWGLTIWGLSYHVNRTVDYNEGNWGLGIRYYVKPRLVFVEADALRNSNRGLVLPVSAGVELGIGSIGRCRLSAIGAFTVAYYRNQRMDTSQVKFGPVPGMSIGCGHFKANMLAVLRPSNEPLAAIVWSMTILL